MASRLTDRLWRTRSAARMLLALSRIWPRVLPMLIVLALFASAAWFGLFRLLPDNGRLFLAGGFGLALLAALVPLLRIRLPGQAEIDRHIERANRLAHTPLLVQSDRLAGPADPFAEALWREHRQRAAGKLSALTAGLPRTGVPQRDPWGARAAVALLFVIAFSWSLGPHGGSIRDAFRAPAAASGASVRIDAWVTPPAYTGRPPLFLTAASHLEGEVYSFPAGSIATARASGGDGDFTLTLQAGDDTVEGEEEVVEGGQARQFHLTLDRDGRLELREGGTALRGWDVTIVSDRAPEIAFTAPPRRARNGALELSYAVKDDYGVASAEAIIRPADAITDAEARPLYGPPELKLPLPARGKSEARVSRDLTAHPWAGAEVTMHLEAMDGSGQKGVSAEEHFVLPQRPFRNPLAQAVVEQRRILALDANRKPRVLEMMEALLLWPEETIGNAGHFLALHTAHVRLSMARSDEALRDVADYLWEIALGIEDGQLSQAERRLREAQEALRDALERGADDAEIERLMAELREAMREYLSELAERALRDPALADSMPPGGTELSRSDLERMLDEIEALARSGALDQANELLSRLQEMMNNLQAMRPQQGGQQGQMRQQMDQLGDLMRRQQQLMNETFRLEQNPSGEGDQQTMQGLAEQQGALREELQQLMEALRGMGIEPGEGFGEAGEHMGEAGRQLGEGRGDRAVGEQGAALEALRRGATDMLQQMQQAMEGEEGNGAPGMRRPSDRDPLGRPRATTEPDYGDNVEVPDEIDVQRARRILEAIRRRLGDALSPAAEQEYLERLLDLR